MPSTVNLKNFKASNVIFETPIVTKSGFDIYIKYKYESGRTDNLIIETGKMVFPFGVSSMLGAEPSKKGPTKDTNDSLAIAFNDIQDPAIKEFIEFDNRAKKFLETNAVLLKIVDKNDDTQSRKILLKKFMEKNYYCSLKYSKDKDTKEKSDKYPPSIKLKLYKKKDTPTEYNHSFFKKGDNKTPVNMTIDNITEYITSQSNGKCFIKCSKIWKLADGGAGVTWTPEKLRFYEKEVANDFVFEEDSDDEVERLTKNLTIKESEIDTASQHSASSNIKNNRVEVDSDEEDSDEESDDE